VGERVGEAPHAPQDKTVTDASSAQPAALTSALSPSFRPFARWAVAGLLAASAVNAFYQALNEARDIVTRAPEPLPALMLFQFAVGVLATASAVGVWRRSSWSHHAIIAWGLVAAVFVAMLEFLLNLGSDSRAGLLSGAATVLVIAALLAWFARRDQALFVAAPVRDRQKRM
jgi:Kef-type K+ transport system membrane component KefB